MKRNPTRKSSIIPDFLKAILPSSFLASSTSRSIREVDPRRSTQGIKRIDVNINGRGDLGEKVMNSTINGTFSNATWNSNELGVSQLCRFEHLGKLHDVDAAITNLTSSISYDPFYLCALGTAQLRRFECLGNMRDINASISHLKLAVERSFPGTLDQGIFLSDLGFAHLRRFEHLGNLVDLEEAIANIQKAVSIAPKDSLDKAIALSDLGCSFLRRFERLGQLPDIEEAIRNLEHALYIIAEDSIDRAIYLGNLGICKLRRFERLGGFQDIEDSISRLQKAVDITHDQHPIKPMYLANLGLSLLRRFESNGNMSDMDASISHLQSAVKLTSDEHLEKPMLLNNLGSCQISRFGRLGDRSDVEASVSNLRQAVNVTDHHHPNKALYQGNLGIAQLCRFHSLCDVADIESSIDNLQKAVNLTTDDNPNRAMYLANLGISQLRRFEILGQVANLDASLSNLRKAVELTPDDNPNKVLYLGNFGVSHLCRFELFGDQKDIDDAIRNLEAANKVTDDNHANKAMYLGNLGISQLYRFNQFDTKKDIEASISNLQRAVDLTNNDHPNKSMYLGNLGISQLRLFELNKNHEHVNASVSNLQRALKLTTDDHPNRTTFLNNLSESLLAMAEISPQDHDADGAFAVFQQASNLKTAYPIKALDAARRWAKRFHLKNDLSSALDVYRTALGILPKFAWLGSDIISRQVSLIRAHSEEIVSAAAACAVGLGHLEEAVELLDSGRSLIWQQASMLHTDLDVLRNESPRLKGLADELQSVSRQLALESFSAPLVHTQHLSGAVEQKWQVDIGGKRRRLAERWEELLEMVRNDPSEKFREFLKPIRFEMLRDAAAKGVVVIINVSVYGVDALIVDATKPIQHVHLRIKAETISKLSKNITLYRPSSYASANERRYYTRTYLRPALRTIWQHIMLPIFEKLQISVIPGDSRPNRRIWWYPTGPLTFIPMHAAGPHDGETLVDVSDLVISSYAITLASLKQALPKSERSEGPEKFLLISHSGTPEHGMLRRCPEEAKRIAALIQEAASEDVISHLNDSDATVDNVARELEGCSWAHFACHGVQDAKSGVRSAFLLHDGDLALSHVASKRLLLGRFAFLSVCHAASGLTDLPGEAMHLAGTLQFIGFPTVVATVWSIMDQDALFVADKTYREMFCEGRCRPDSSKAGVALNQAVYELRRCMDVTLDRWAPFIHIGA